MFERKPGVILVPSLLFGGLLLVGPFFFLFPLWNAGLFGIGFFWLLEACGIFFVWPTFHLWHKQTLIATEPKRAHIEALLDEADPAVLSAVETLLDGQSQKEDDK